MIELQRTRDYQLVASIMRRREIYRSLADDFYPAPEQFLPIASEGLVHLLAFDGDRQGELLGVLVAHPINPVLWEVHHALLPSCWGARAHAVGIAFEAWLWENTLAQTAFGFTPECNRLALRYARRHGMRECGRIPRAWQKDGELFDIIILAKSRPA